MANVFISYARKDYRDKDGQIIVGNPIDKIKETLKANGVEYWIDERINPGDPFAKNIGDAISNCDVFLFVSSVNSNESEWAHGEIATARTLNKRIIPIKIDDAQYHTSYLVYMAHLDFIDYTQDKNMALQKLVHYVLEKRINVNLPDYITFQKKGKDLNLGKEKLSQKVERLFKSFALSDAITCFLDIVTEIKKLTGAQCKGLEDAVKKLNHVKDFSNADFQKKSLSGICMSMYESSMSVSRVDKLLLQLGLMSLYFYLGEIAVLKKIQNEIRECRFDLSWWEKNGDDIKEIGGMAFGFAAALFTGTNAGAGMLYGHKSGKQASDQHKNKVKQSKLYFDALQDTILSVNFH